MKTLYLIKKKWDDFFFNYFAEKDFQVYRFIIFMYIFLFVGFDDLVATTNLENLWNPISFFTFFSFPILVSICEWSFYFIKVFSLLAAFNYFYRISSKACFIALAFNLGFYSNFGKVFHGYQFLVITTGLLSCIHFSDKSNNLWPLQLIKIYGASIYFMAAINKMVFSGLDWVVSENLYRFIASTPGKTWLAKFILENDPKFSIILSFFVMFLFQLPAIISPFSKVVGIYLFCGAFAFHIGVSLIFGGHTSFLSHLVCLLIFLPLEKFSRQLT